MRLPSDCYKVILVLLLILVYNGVGRSAKIKRNSRVFHVRNHLFKENTVIPPKSQGRGFLTGGLVSLSKVLNFFPVGGERECQPEGFSIAKSGICLNQYDCRQREGRASGDCADGLGVCCVFEVTCDGIVQNNLTYFMSPGFPEFWSGDTSCNITIEKTYAGIMQLRIDFLHFTIGQPNRTTGECDEDVMVIGDGESQFKLCGQNHGQHVYYTLSTANEKREAGELAGTRSVQLSMRMVGDDMPRLWLMRVAQMPIADSSPHGCLQYYTTNNGTIRTFNYAINGRHLASQQYKACVRKNKGFCSIRYTPCDARSFRIGSDGTMQTYTSVTNPPEDGMMPINQDTNMQTQEDEIEGSGNDPGIEANTSGNTAAAKTPPLTSRIWRYLTSWMWGGQQRSFRWSPYIQNLRDDDKLRYVGYGTYGIGFGRQRCQDRITIPCENEYFISTSYYGTGVCDPHHCGNTLCPGISHKQCRIDTSISPFAVSINFGPPTPKSNPEDNIGMCLRYTQLGCDA